MSIEPKFFYSNSSELTASAYEIGIRFMRNGVPVSEVPHGTVGTSESAEATVQDVMVVAMSPGHAKAILPGLLNVVRQYEEQFGSIPLPADAAAQWAKFFPGSK